MKYFALLVLSAVMLSAYGQNKTEIYQMGDLTTGSRDSFTYAVVGDYGNDSREERAVADMIIKDWKPAFIITTGDNDYEDKLPAGSGKNIDTFITKYYSAYMSKTLSKNRFFPVLGNHDQKKKSVEKDYMNLFPYLNDAENYEFSWGPVHFYALNSGPDGIGCIMNDTLLRAVKKKLDADTASGQYRILLYHHPLYSSRFGAEPNHCNMEGKGIDAVLNGHIHYYERLTDTVRHIEYVTIGNSGRNDDGCPDAADNKMANNRKIVCGPCRGNQNGALKVTVVRTNKGSKQAHWKMTFEYYNVANPQSPSDVMVINK